MNIFTSAARACKKLLAFVADISSPKTPPFESDTEMNGVNAIVVPVAGCDNKPANTKSFISDNYNDAKQSDASFSFLTNASSFKISVMKQILRCLNIVVSFLTGLANHFFKGLFKDGLFNNENKSGELNMVPVNIQPISNLPFNQHAMRSFLPTANPDKNSFIKKMVRKTGVFAIALLIANLFLLTSVIGQNSNVTINATSTTNGTWSGGTTGPYQFTPTANSATILNSDIQNRLTGTGFTANNVTIVTAFASGTQNGDVTFSTTLTAATTTTTQRTFNVTANGIITVSNAINFSAANGGNNHHGTNVTLISNTANVLISAAISTTGGNGNFFGTGGNAGAVSIAGATGISLTANLTANGGTATAGTTGADGDYTINDGAGAVGGSNNGQTAGVIDGGNLTNSGTGIFAMAGANVYAGTTTVTGGVLLLNNATAIPGGIGNTGGTGNIVINGGVIGLGNGNFSRGLGTGATQVQFTGSGGFAAYGAARTVNLGNAAAQVTWATGSFVPTGSSLILSASSANNTVTFANPIALGAVTRTIQTDEGSASIDAIISAVISGTGALTKTGNGLLQLSGSNSYSGLTTISTGTLQLGATGTSPNSPLGTTAGATSVSSGAVLDLNGFTLAIAEPLTLNGTGLTASPAGALVNSSATAATYSGLVALGSASSIVSNSGNIILSNTGTVTGPTFGLTLDGTATGSSIASIIGTTTGTLTKNSTGTWTLSGLNTYTGATTINSGSLTANIATTGANGAFGNASAVTLSNTAGVVLNLNGFNTTIGSLAGGGATGGSVTLGSATLTTGSNGQTTSYAGNISGTGGATMNGNGIMTLSGTNTYSGGTTINSGGTIILGNNSALGSPSGATLATVNSGGTLDVASQTLTIPTPRLLAINGAGVGSNGALISSGTGTIAAAGTGSVNLATSASLGGSGNLTISAPINGTGSALTKVGAGTLTLSGVNIYTGATSINGGILSINTIGNSGTNTAIGNSSAAINLGAGTLQYTGSGSTSARPITLTATGATIDGSGTGALSLSGSITGAFNLTLTGNASGANSSTESGVIGTGNGTLTKSGSGTWILSNTNTYTGSTTVSAGTLQIQKTGYTAPITATTVTMNFSPAPTVGSYAILPGALNGSQTFSATGLSANETATFTASNSTVTVGGITPAATTMTAFTTTYGTASATQNVTITGSGLPSIINVAAPLTGFEISTDGGTTWTSGAATLPATGGTITVRLKATAVVSGTYNNQTITTLTNGSTSATISSAATGNTVSKANLTVTADPKSKTYDGSVFSPFTSTISGFVNSETISVVSGLATYTGAATTAINAGSYTITPQLGSLTAANYNFTTFTNGTLTINKANLTVTADPKSKTYDGSVFSSFTSTISGFVNSETVSVVSGSATYTGAATAAINAGSYTITPQLGSLTAANYNFTTFTNGTLTINKANLTVTADPKSKTYDGSVFSSFTSTISGFVNSETVSVVSGSATYTGAATTAVNAGSYTITPQLGSLTAANYNFTTFTNGTLTITQLALVGSFTASDKVYDGNTSATVTGYSVATKIGSDDVNITGGTATFDNANVGTNKTVTLTGATLTGADAANYSLTSVNTTTASITQLALVGSFTASDKVYDGNTSATVTGYSVATKIGSDDVNITGGTATFDNANVGTNKTVTLTGATLTGADAANYSLTSVNTTTASITQLALVGSFTASDKVYDGNTSATVTGYSVATKIGSDDVNITGGTATFDNANVGTNKTVTLTGATLTGADAANYSLTSVNTTTASITQLALVGSFTASDKVYDGNTSATVTGYSVATKIGSDDVNITGGTATFDNANVGTNKTVTLTGATLTGADAANYSLTSVNTTTASITQLALVGSFTASDKVYDGNTSATVTGYSVATKIGSDDVNITGGTATFDNANVGTNKTVTLTGATLTGADAANYSLTSVNTTTASITQLALVGSFTASDKVYDGNTSATVTGYSVATKIGSDDVNITGGTATFDNANVGTNKTVTLTGATLTGADAANYSLTSVNTTTASITQLALVGSFTASDKVYDGNTSATVTGYSVATKIGSDDVNITGGTATFDNANVGTNKTVTLTGATLTGADAANYSLTSVNTTTASITQLALVGSFTASDKVYDGNTSATVTGYSVATKIGSDDVNITGGTATFDNANVGTNKTVTLTGATLTGADAANYSLTSVNTTTASITQLALVGSFTASDKVYDGNTSATVTGYSVATKIGSDDVNITGGTATFDNANVGTNKTVTLTGATLTGADAANYSLTSVNTTTASITQLALVGSFTASDKVYDGNTSATVTGYSVATKIGSDDVNITGGTATFDNANVGTNKTVTLTGATLTGADAANYSLTSVNTTTASITQLALVGSFTASDKVYDGNTSATVTGYSVATKIGSDDVNITGGTATFDNANVGTNKTVTLTGATLTGADAANYSLTSVNTTTASITQLALVGSFTASDKVYDGNTSATVTGYSVATKIGSDDVNITGGTATFDNANVGTNKTVTLTGATLTGADAANYSLTSVNTTTASITQLALVGSFTASDKVYDGNTSATVTGYSVATKIGSDDVNITGGTATFDNANVGTNKTVTLTGATLTGADAANYSLTSVNTTTASITQLALVGSFTASDKVYDGNTSATVTGYSVATKIGSDDVNITGGTATFDNANVGTNKTVTLTGATLTGADAANYSLTSVNTTTASITQLALVGSFTASDKVYDGNTSATVTGYSVATKIGSDDVNITGGTATFDNANVGTNKTVTLTGATLTGADAANYSLTSVNTTTASITQLALVGSFTASDKVYDGNTSATVTGYSVATKIGSDDVNITGGTATFDNANVGTNKTVTLTGATLTGADAANYSLTSVNTTTASITQLALVGSFTASDKVYDGNTSATVTGYSVATKIGSDDVNITGGTATFDNANVGTNKTVTLTGATLTGADAANYSLTSVNTTTASITAKSLTITANDQSKCIGQAFSFNGDEFMTSGLATGDFVTSLTLTSAGSPSTAAAGTYPIIPSAAVGNGLSNYNIIYDNGTFTVIANPTIILSSTAGTDAQTICFNSAIANITYLVGGAVTNVSVAGLPDGVTGVYDSNTGIVTISGTPMVFSTLPFSYVVNVTGVCTNISLGGTITVNATPTATIDGTTTACQNGSQPVITFTNQVALPVTITYTLSDGTTTNTLTIPVAGNATATVNALTATPGVFTYTLTSIQYNSSPNCTNPITGQSAIITVSPTPVATIAGTTTLCINGTPPTITFTNPMALPVTITYHINTGADLTINVNATSTNTVTAPANVAGVFTYTATSVQYQGTPNCPNTLTGQSATVTVNDNSTITLSSGIGTDGQTICITHALTDITYAIGGGGTGASITSGALPPGVTGLYSAGVFTIHGTPTAPGSYTYTVTTAGPCNNVSISGTITVNANSTISLSSAANTDAQTVCNNTGISPITYAVGGGGTGASITGGSLPSGVSGIYNSSTGVFTISGTPTASGIFSYTVTTAGPCVNDSRSGTITVNPIPVVNLVSNATYCNNTPGAAISFSSPTPGAVIYNWTSTANVGFGTNGSGNIGSYTATNTTNSPVTATVSVTPTLNGCIGLPITFTITVNPSPGINAISNLTYCNNTPGAAITFSSPAISGTVTYSWTSSVNVGFGLNGNGNIGAFTATNNSINPLVATVTVTPALNGCNGTPITFTVTVNPNVNAGTISGFATLCPSGGTDQLSTNGIAGGTWTSSNPTIASVDPATGLVTPHATGSTTIFYTVSNACGASTATFSILVNSTASAGTILGSNTVCVNGSTQLVTTGNGGGTWFSSNTAIATVNAAGLVTGVTGGTATIFYFVTNACGFDITSTAITVGAGAVAGTIFTTTPSVCAGSLAQLFTTGTAGGTWASSNNAVALPLGNGFFFGQSAGTAIITYTVPSSACSAGPTVAFFTLTVTPISNAGAISGPTTVCVGASIPLISSGLSGGTWSSGNPSAAVNSVTGLVTGVSAGSATISYTVTSTCGGTSVATYLVTVSPNVNAGTISGPSTVCNGSTINLSSSGSTGGIWSSNNNSVAIVDVNGVVFGTGTGTATITYTVVSSCASSSASAVVTVNPVPTAGTISGAASVCAGLSTPFTTNGTTGGTWSSSNTAAATVNSSTGLITAVAAGNSIITYTVTTSCGTATASAGITVNPVLNAGTISGGSAVCVGANINLSSNGSAGGSWTSSNTGVATVDAVSGVVSGVAAGNTTITYKVSNVCGTSTTTQLVTVNAVPNAGTITGASSVCAGLSTSFASNGTSGGSWSSSNTAAATVNATTGLVTAVAAGNATITYTITTSCGTATASALITVNPVLNAGTISGASSICVGSAMNLSSNGSTGGGWSSNNTGVATVDASGLITGVAPGNVTITYTVSNSCGTSTATKAVTVIAVANAGTVSGALSVCTGLSTPFTSTGISGGSWSSSNTAVATVDVTTGVVTGVTAGTSTITYTINGSCGNATASANITVNPLADAGTISGPNAVCVGASINLSSSSLTTGTWASNSTAIATINSSGKVAGVSPGVTTITYTVTTSCGTSISSYTVTVNAVPNAGIINGSSDVCVGSSLFLTSTGGMINGTWRSANTARATVDPATGQVTGVAAGTAIITYSVTNSCGASVASIVISVNSLPNAGSISGASSVCTGSSINLSASGDAGGTWSSTTPGVATVDPTTGVVTGVAQGNATIIYTVGSPDICGTSAATRLITVNPVPNAGTLSGASTLCVGLATTFTTNGSVGGTWSSSNPSVATVNPSSGLVTGIAAGTTTISYTVTTASCGSATALATLTVSPLLNAGTVIGPSAVCVGSNITLSATGDIGGAWTSSNPAVASVDGFSGLVTGLTPGNTTITYTLSNSCITSTATKSITVNPVPTAGIVTGAPTMCIGAATSFTNTGTVGGTWSSSNTAAATVNSSTGLVTAVGAGSATITYTISTSCGTSTASATVAVNPGLNAGTISGPSAVCAGSTITLNSTNTGGVWTSGATSVATIDPSSGLVTGITGGNATISYTVTTSCGTSTAIYTITVNPVLVAGTVSGSSSVCIGSTTTLSSNGSTGGSWSSSNTSAATVNATTGMVTGVGAGSTTITYTVSSVCGTASSSAPITVNALPNAGTVTGATALCVGSSSIFGSNGTGGGSWSSNNTAAATVNPTTGEVTGVAPGSATITYTVSGSCGSASASANITITALPNAGTVSGATAMCAGSATTFTSNGMGSGSWSSNNNIVATVNPSTGLVTAIGAGSATITYTVTNTCGTASASAGVTINALPNSGTVSGAATLCVGANTSFTSTGDGAGSWSSNNTAVATVNSVTGLVSGVSAGSATISYTVTGTCGSSVASANITIKALPNPGTISGTTSVCVNGTTTFSSNGDINGSWSSNNTAIATVNATTGVVTGVAAGATTINYTITNSCGTATASQVIIVNPLPNAGTISGSTTVCVGSGTNYTSNGDINGTWSSNNTAVATLGAASGVVSGVTTGTATITYTVVSPFGCGTASTSFIVTVITLPNAGAVSGLTAICAGSATTYTSNGVSGGTWSSATLAVATVDGTTGVVTGHSFGNSTITYTVTNACGTSTASQVISVNALPNAGTVSGAATVCIGASTTFGTTSTGPGSWSSSNSSIASVDAGTGVVTGHATGTAAITFTSTTASCGSATASANVTVITLPNAGTVSGLTSVCMGTTPTYTSSGISLGTWSSSSTGVATINPASGTITTVAPGITTITYTVTNSCGTSSAQLIIAINALPNAGTVSGASTVCAGSNATFTSNGLSGGTWSSSNPSIASVSGSGVVTGVVAGGPVTITYTSTTPCGTAFATANITVNPVVNAGTVSGASILCIGSTTTFTSNGTPGGTWSSLTPGVATVNPTTGVVTGVSTGNATISYSFASGCGAPSSSSKLIAVSVAGNPGTISGATSLCAGSSVTFTRSGGSNGGTWSSSNTSVATVTSSGRVTGVGGGSAVISYSVTTGCGTASATQSITVSSAPSIVANDITASTDPNTCSATLTLGSNVTVTGSPSTIQYRIGIFIFSFPIPPTFTFFRGTTPVTVVASNSCGTTARVFLVTVNDNQPPTIACVPNANRTTNNSRYTVRGREFDASASDGCGVASLIYSLSGATVDGFDRDNTSLNNVRLNVGTTTITWKATDVNGNVSTCSTNVTVTNTGGGSAAPPDQTFNPKLALLDTIPALTATVAPNPTNTHFTIALKSGRTEKVKLTVVDVMGRTIEKMTNIWPNSTLQIGGSYHPGVYMVQLIQGEQKVMLKLIKEGN